MDKIIERAKTPVIFLLLGIIVIGQASVFQQARVAQEYKMNWNTAAENLNRANEKNRELKKDFDAIKVAARSAIETSTESLELTKKATAGWAACRAEQRP